MTPKIKAFPYPSTISCCTFWKVPFKDLNTLIITADAPKTSAENCIATINFLFRFDTPYWTWSHDLHVISTSCEG